MKFVLVFLVLFMTIAINLPDDMIKGIGLDPKYLMAALGAWIFAGLLSNGKMLLVVLVIGMAMLANLPASSLDNMGIDKTYLLIGLLCVAITPFFMKSSGR